MRVDLHSTAGATAKLLMDRQAAMHQMQPIRGLYQMRQTDSKLLVTQLQRQGNLDMTYKQALMYKLLQTFKAALQSIAWAGLRCLRRTGTVL